MRIVLEIEPPRGTAQEKSIAYNNGRPVIYEKKSAREARELLTLMLRKYKPSEPIDGAVRLTVRWFFKNYTIYRGRRVKNHKQKYKTTRPDTDNMVKGLKDVLTHLGYWNDDAQVAEEFCGKYWSDTPRIEIEIEHLPEN